MGKILSDFGGAASIILAYVGDKLGLYKAMSDFGKPITSTELANLDMAKGTHILMYLKCIEGISLMLDKRVKELLEQGKSTREFADEVHISFGVIGSIRRRLFGETEAQTENDL